MAHTIKAGKTYILELHSNQLEALLLKALDYVTHESTLNTVGLDHYEGTFLVRRGHGW